MPRRTDNLVRLSITTDLTEFDCGDADLNEFLLKDARRYMTELLTVTYLVMENSTIAAYFSLANDLLTCDPSTPEGKRGWNKLTRSIPNKKRRKSFPAVKLGRLAVDGTFKGAGLGREILDYLKQWFIVGNKTGCRFITVDAYNERQVLRFFEGYGFRFLTPEKD